MWYSSQIFFQISMSLELHFCYFYFSTFYWLWCDSYMWLISIYMTVICIFYVFLLFVFNLSIDKGFPCDSPDKESACNAGDLGSIPGLGRSPREGKGYLTPVFCPREFHGLYPWGCKELDMTFTHSLSIVKVIKKISKTMIFKNQSCISWNKYHIHSHFFCQ